MFRSLFLLILVTTLFLLNRVADAQTLQNVRERGSLLCGLSQDVPGFSSPDTKGGWSGFDVDFCRAVAAAVLRDPAKVIFVPLSDGSRLSALRSGQIDLLARVSTFTLFDNMWFDMKFAGATYFGGQGFLVRKSLKVESATALKNASICLQAGAPNEERVTAYIKWKDPEAEMMRFTSYDDAVRAYEEGYCDAIAASISQLYASRLKLSKPNDHIGLADVISKDPQGPVVRHSDSQWSEIVKWVVFAMIDAELLGVTQSNVGRIKLSSGPEVKRLLGTEGNFGVQLGLADDWVVQIVKAIGNYGESFDRNLGAGSRLGISRGANELWIRGGVQYAPPF